MEFEKQPIIYKCPLSTRGWLGYSPHGQYQKVIASLTDADHDYKKLIHM